MCTKHHKMISILLATFLVAAVGALEESEATSIRILVDRHVPKEYRGTVILNESSDMCEWRGINCFDNHVTGLHLRKQHLRGHFDGALVNNLTAMTMIEVSFGTLEGTLPNFTFCSQMYKIYMGSNRFSGTLPEWSHLTLLSVIAIGENHLSGTLPASWTKMTTLESCDVGGNAGLFGVVPPELAKLGKHMVVGDTRMTNPYAPWTPPPNTTGVWDRGAEISEVQKLFGPWVTPRRVYFIGLGIAAVIMFVALVTGHATPSEVLATVVVLTYDYFFFARGPRN